MYVNGLDLSSVAKPDVFVNEAAMQNNRHLSSSLLMESNPAILVMISLKFPKAEYLQPPRRSFVLVMCRSQNFNPCRVHPLPLPTKSSYLFCISPTELAIMLAVLKVETLFKKAGCDVKHGDDFAFTSPSISYLIKFIVRTRENLREFLTLIRSSISY